MNPGAAGSSQAPIGRSSASPRLGWTVFGLASAAFWLSFFHRVAPAAIADDGPYAGAHFTPGIALLTLFAGIAVAGGLFIRETRCRNIWPDFQTGKAA